MQISESWLREWVDPGVSTEKLVEQFTMAGLEVDSVNPAAAEFSGVVVAEIIACNPHPDADKLSVCQVHDGQQTLQVVCGAPNAREGIKVPLATVGGVLPGNFKIKKAKLRGVESFGMLCAAEELGLAEHSEGLLELPEDAPVGTDIREYMALDDHVIEIDLTPNRGDCLSIRGLARDIAVLNACDFTEPSIDPVKPAHQDVLSVGISARDGCEVYAGRIIHGIKPGVSSPLWMQEKLRRCGVRPIDAIVDVTNYVMLELGQPLHAFDLEKLSGPIDVRWSSQGETLQLLDGKEIELDSDTLLIADANGPVAMAGVMGGQATAVDENTTSIFLEAAFFVPEAIAGRARRYGLHTDASHRFERGVDPALVERALDRATELLELIVGGKPGAIEKAGSIESRLSREARLRIGRVEQLLGFALEEARVLDILARLGCQLDSRDGDVLSFRVPSYRFDIEGEVDLIEELGRVYGYNRIPIKALPSGPGPRIASETELFLDTVKLQLSSMGYQEVITYSFVSPELQNLIDPDLEPLKLANPISADLSVMRTSLWPGLLSVASSNLKRQQDSVRIFEAGMEFVPDAGGLKQVPVIAGLLTGQAEPENWANSDRIVDFFDAKGHLECLLGLTGSELSVAKETRDGLHPGQTAVLKSNDKTIGYLGALHPLVSRKFGFSRPVFLFRVLQQALVARPLPHFSELSRFPQVRRDLAFIVDQSVEAGSLLSLIRQASGDLLKDVCLFDVYSGDNLPEGQKSIALGLTLQHQSRTLTEDDVNSLVDSVVSLLKQELKAQLRE